MMMSKASGLFRQLGVLLLAEVSAYKDNCYTKSVSSSISFEHVFELSEVAQVASNCSVSPLV